MAAPLDKSQRPLRVVFYTRHGCHLCDDALAILLRHGVAPTIIDIDNQAELQKRFTACVPVVEIDGHIRFRGKVSPVLLRRQLRLWRDSDQDRIE